jgi:hypothetical protein
VDVKNVMNGFSSVPQAFSFEAADRGAIIGSS